MSIGTRVRRLRFVLIVATVLACCSAPFLILFNTDEDESPAEKLWRAVRPIGESLGLVEDHRVTSDKEGRCLPGFSLKELACAMHDYHQQHGRFPPAALCSDDGTPLLSWRVLLLPYLEQNHLFHKFKLNEPWDSPNNIALLRAMPQVYAPLPGDPPLPPYTTALQVFVGKGTAFEGPTGLRLGDFPRPSYTILIAEAKNPVPWTKPADLVYDGRRAIPPLGAYFRGYSHVVMADTYAMRVLRRTKEAKLREAILRDSHGPGLYEE